jgi:hypothetical protein
VGQKSQRLRSRSAISIRAVLLRIHHTLARTVEAQSFGKLFAADGIADGLVGKGRVTDAGAHSYVQSDLRVFLLDEEGGAVVAGVQGGFSFMLVEVG